MNYDAIILEMLSRIQELEKQMAALTGQRNNNQTTAKAGEKISTPQIEVYIEQLKRDAAENGEPCLQLRANEIHRALRLKSRFPMVCNAMRKCMRKGDEIVHETPSGYSSTLEIRYYLGDTKEDSSQMTYSKLIENFVVNPRDVHTVPTNGTEPKWFYVFVENGTLCVRSSQLQDKNNCIITGTRELKSEELDAMLDIYYRRSAGESVSREASATTVNQVYWYGIFADMGL